MSMGTRDGTGLGAFLVCKWRSALLSLRLAPKRWNVDGSPGALTGAIIYTSYPISTAVNSAIGESVGLIDLLVMGRDIDWFELMAAVY